MFRIEENGLFRGVITFLNAMLNAGCVGDSQVASLAGIAASKLEHQHRPNYSQESDTTTADEAHVIHAVKGTAGTLKTFEIGQVVANIGAATVTVDLLKNGVSVLVAAVELTAVEAAYAMKAGTIDTAAVAADDILEVSVVAVAGGGTIGKGVFALLDLFEDQA